MTISRHQFGSRVGCDYTTASRLMSGDRAPSTRLLNSICKEFKLDPGEAMRALGQDQERADDKYTSFAGWLTSALGIEATTEEDVEVAASP